MSLPEYASQSVGNVASKSTAFAKVLNDAGVDFCCHGSDGFSEDCRKAGADPEKVAKELDSVVGVPAQMSHDFNTWPTDLLSDYVLKVHHRGIRRWARRFWTCSRRLSKCTARITPNSTKSSLSSSRPWWI